LQADFSVELGQDDPALELPWASGDHSVRYYDLKRFPELALQIPEAVAHPELSAFLTRMNAPDSPFATAKCDVWPSRDISAEEEIFGAPEKFVSYVDLVFVDTNASISFEKHEAFAEKLCILLGRVPDIPAAVEMVIRRCYFHQPRADHQGEIEKARSCSEESRADSLESPSLGLKSLSEENVLLKGASRESVSQERPPLDIMPIQNLPLKKIPTGNDPFDGSQAETTLLKDLSPEPSSQSFPAQRLPLQSFRLKNLSLKNVLQSAPSQSTPSNSTPSNNTPSNNTPLDDSNESISGHCLTAYVTGFGDSDHEARRQWVIALALLQHALLQASRQ
jgi:hypothetical protein